MSKVMVTYSTNSGSTVDVAEIVKDELVRCGHEVNLMPITDVQGVSGYDLLVVGAPMIFGWHKPAVKFLRRYRSSLAGKRIAFFACAMRLTVEPGVSYPIPLVIDPSLAADPEKKGSKSLKERFTTTGYYLAPMLKAIPNTKLLSVAFFKGRLEMFRLKWWQAAFVMFIVGATPGDFRDHDFIKSWSMALGEKIN